MVVVPFAQTETGSQSAVGRFHLSEKNIWRKNRRSSHNVCNKRESENILVVGMIAPNVGGAVGEPGGVECEYVTKDGSDEKSCFERLAPKVPRHNGRQRKTHQCQRNVISNKRNFKTKQNKKT
jgi:hypothetical protein